MTYNAKPIYLNGSQPSREQPRSLLFIEMLAMTAAIGVLDYATGSEVSVLVVYAFPILVAAWYSGRTHGITLAVFGALTWWAANFDSHTYRTAWGYGIAALTRLAYFVFVAIGAAALRKQRESDLTRIEALERTRQLEQEIVRTCEREQARIGRDLHDGLCQHLAAITIALRCLANSPQCESAPLKTKMLEIEQFLRDAVDQARTLAHGLAPAPVDGLGLSIALHEMAAAAGRLTSIRVSFEEEGDTGISDSGVATQLLRIAQEALSNAIKHSQANNICISLSRNARDLILSVTDDGEGMPHPPPRHVGIGMATMGYRAQSIEADLRIESKPKKGTTVMCMLPAERIS